MLHKPKSSLGISDRAIANRLVQILNNFGKHRRRIICCFFGKIGRGELNFLGLWIYFFRSITDAYVSSCKHVSYLPGSAVNHLYHRILLLRYLNRFVLKKTVDCCLVYHFHLSPLHLNKYKSNNLNRKENKIIKQNSSLHAIRIIVSWGRLRTASGCTIIIQIDFMIHLGKI